MVILNSHIQLEYTTLNLNSQQFRSFKPCSIAMMLVSIYNTDCMNE
jgi:hypothetical protein